jgi:hypothetical protein
MFLLYWTCMSWNVTVHFCIAVYLFYFLMTIVCYIIPKGEELVKLYKLVSNPFAYSVNNQICSNQTTRVMCVVFI